MPKCAYEHCGEHIDYYDVAWELDGDYFCSAECVAKHVGADTASCFPSDHEDDPWVDREVEERWLREKGIL